MMGEMGLFMERENFRSVSELAWKAYKEKYSVAMIDVTNMEFVRAVIDVANEERSPIMLGFPPLSVEKEPEVVETLVEYTCKNSRVPFAIHLDHGRNLSDIAKAIKLGFTGVMIDATHLPLKENMALTKKVVEIAHLFGVSVEGEIGRIRGEEVGMENEEELNVEELTDPKIAKQFVEFTEVDLLSPSVGTVHGMKFRDKVRVEVLLVKKISDATKIPLALHGSFRTPDNIIKQAIEAGVCKVNLALHFWEPFMKGVRESLQTEEEIVPPELIFGKGMNYVREEIRYRIRLLGSNGKA
jgi:fructose-bisphosphate aldolase class II